VLMAARVHLQDIT